MGKSELSRNLVNSHYLGFFTDGPLTIKQFMERSGFNYKTVWKQFQYMVEMGLLSKGKTKTAMHEDLYYRSSEAQVPFIKYKTDKPERLDHVVERLLNKPTENLTPTDKMLLKYVYDARYAVHVSEPLSEQTDIEKFRASLTQQISSFRKMADDFASLLDHPQLWDDYEISKWYKAGHGDNFSLDVHNKLVEWVKENV